MRRGGGYRSEGGREILFRQGAFAKCRLTEEFDTASQGANDDPGRANFPDLWPIELKLSADPGQVGFHGSGLDVVAHVNDVEAKCIWCGFNRKVMLFTKGGI